MKELEMLQQVPPWEWPEEAGQLLLDVLCDEQAPEADVCLAAELAGEMADIDDDIARALLSVVVRNDKPVAVRAAAAIALGPALELADEGFDELSVAPISEALFHEIQAELQRIYTAAEVPKDVRRRVLETSVRAPQAWHHGAVRAAYASNDAEWRLTAVFCMRFINGFEKSILEALASDDPVIEYEALVAAGNWGIAEAWPHIAALLQSESIEKPLLLAAIEAAASVDPSAAPELLGDLMDADDEEIADAAYEAIALLQAAEEAEAADDDDLDRDD